MTEELLKPTEEVEEQGAKEKLDMMTDDQRTTIVSKYMKKFDTAQRYRKPREEKDLRMYKLYRAYRDPRTDGKAYSYFTNMMPPIAFKIIETIKPRLSTGNMMLKALPGDEDALNRREEMSQWENLINNVMTMSPEFKNARDETIHASLQYGDGYFLIYWDGEKPRYISLDNATLYADPNAGPKLKGSAYEIRQMFRDYETFKKVNEKTGIYSHLDKCTGGTTATGIDPRWERERLETVRMGKIGTTNKPGEVSDHEKQQRESQIEILEIFDHEEQKIVVIANRTQLIRYEDSPYKKVNGGQVVVNLPCIKQPWSKDSMSILEPVESIINEIADTRNHAMENIEYNQDPTIIVRKGAIADLTKLKRGPGEKWELTNSDDAKVLEGNNIPDDWMAKNNMLEREIDVTLALSEYTSGNPNSGQEPADKVDMLLQQSAIRFGKLVEQLEDFYTEVANIVMQMYIEFTDTEISYRDDYSGTNEYKKFNPKTAPVVQLRFEVEPVDVKLPRERKKELLEIYDKFIVEDAPGETATPEEVAKYQERKRELQKMLLEEYGKDQYAALIEQIDKGSATGPPQPEAEIEQPQNIIGNIKNLWNKNPQ